VTNGWGHSNSLHRLSFTETKKSQQQAKYSCTVVHGSDSTVHSKDMPDAVTWAKVTCKHNAF